ncbi:hypothetical protein EON65_19455, partial [archaeon]
MSESPKERMPEEDDTTEAPLTMAASVVLPELDGSSDTIRGAQQTTIESVVQLLGQRADSLQDAAQAV